MTEQTPPPQQFPTIETGRLVLTIPPADDAPRMLSFVEDNREHLAPWSPPAPEGYFTEDFWRGRLAERRAEFQRGTSVHFVLFRRDDPRGGRPVGVCDFTQIARGAFQACYLGYDLDHREVGKGLMFEALGGAISYAFDEMKLHRIMANYRPANERSARLLRRLGFVIEGYARDYLFIAGSWQDHILTSLTNQKLDRP